MLVICIANFEPSSMGLAQLEGSLTCLYTLWGGSAWEQDQLATHIPLPPPFLQHPCGLSLSEMSSFEGDQ